MMKKLLTLMFVFGLMPLASAGIVLSVDGVVPAPDSIELRPSDTISLDIFIEGPESPTVNSATGMPTNGGTLLAGGDLKVQVRGSGPVGTLDSSGMVFPTLYTGYEQITNTVKFDDEDGTFSVGLAAWEAKWSEIASASDFVLISGGNLNNNTIGGYTLMDGLEFHCEAYDDVYIDLIAAWDIIYYTWTVTGDDFMGYTAEVDEMIAIYEQGDVIDTIRLIVVPEPTTIVLLGLSGLLLRRRK